MYINVDLTMIINHMNPIIWAYKLFINGLLTVYIYGKMLVNNIFITHMDGWKIWLYYTNMGL